MKVSINLAQEYSNVDLKSISPNEMLKKIGAQLGAVEETIDWASKFKGVYVVKVVKCEKHPNADKLSVCLIDDRGVVKDVERNKDGLITVVCGAPNVKAGMFVAWLPPGSTVPVTKGTGSEFVLEGRELRGVVSNGMLASAHELAINDDHSGLLEITAGSNGKEPAVGDELKKYYGLDDFVIDCENKMFTHRPDCFGNLGVARELAGINGLNFKSPDWYINATEHKPTSKLDFISKNEIKDMVPRFMAQVYEGVTIAPSSLERQITLARVGIRSINNIVDITNYYMHLTAQPTHAFDYDKIKAFSGKTVTIFPRMAKDGEELTLLNGKTIKLSSKDIVIATDKKAVALAGVMGGAETEVDESTKNIIIECATFDMYNIRRTSMRHGLFTDAVTRFNKGQSPLQNDKVLGQISTELIEMGAKIGQKFDDFDNKKHTQATVNVDAGFINTRLGREFSAEEVADLLARTEFDARVEGDNIHVTAPFWRRDIKLPEDIVEEVGRLYGFDQLPAKLPQRTAKAPVKNKNIEIKRQIANRLANYGANEVLTYSFVHGDIIKKSSQNVDEAYQLRNAISPDLQYYRLSLTPSLLNNVHQNIKAGNKEVALFEIGLSHNRQYGMNEEKVPVEKDALAFVYSVSDKVAKTKDGAAYYTALKYFDALAEDIGLEYHLSQVSDAGDEIVKPFEGSRSALILDSKNNIIGIVGEYKKAVRGAFKLSAHTAGFEIYLGNIFTNLQPKRYKVLSRFPSTEQDITFEVDSKASYQDIKNCIEGFIRDTERRGDYQISYKPLDIYSEGGIKKRITFRLTINHDIKTLTIDEINELLEKLAKIAAVSVNATRI